MATPAGHHRVRPLQREGRFLVLLELVARGQEAVHGVARLARRDLGRGLRRQLPEVGVDVAIGAGAEGQAFELRRLPRERPVTRPARHPDVTAPQGEAGLVVEGRAPILVRLDDLPAHLRVTARAGRPQRALVWILVTALAGLEVDRLHLHEAGGARLGEGARGRVVVGERGVALGAPDVLVLAGQRERRALVVEPGGRLPRRLRVTLLALAPLLTPVLVEVARVAARGQPQIRGLLGVLVEQVTDRRFGDQPALVAVVAVDLRRGVSPFQRPARSLVIELVAGPLPLDHLEVEAPVIGVARLALLALGRRQAPVKAGALGDPRSELRVAVEAEARREALLLLVALRALLEPLQRGVRAGQGPGREELGHCAPGSDDDEQHQAQRDWRARGVAADHENSHRKPTRMLTQKIQFFPGDVLNDFNGTLGYPGFGSGPKWTGSLDTRFKTGGFTFRWGVQYIGKMSSQATANTIFLTDTGGSCPNGAGPGCFPVTYDLAVPSYFEHGVSVQYLLPRIGQFTIGVNNLFDKDPPTISDDATSGFPRFGNFFANGAYDYRGRSVFVNVTRSI